MTGESSREGRRTDLARVYRDYQGGYADRWSMDKPGNRAILQERTTVMTALLKRAGLFAASQGAVLDLGAGSGESFPGFFDASQIVRADLLVQRLLIGRAQAPDATLVCADGSSLPFDDATFDLVVLATVLSSVPESGLRRAIVADVRRVVRPGGGIVCYDFRVGNPRNHHTVPIRRRELRSLLPGCPLALSTLTVAPPLARRLGARTDAIYRVLRGIPPLRTHHLAVWTCP